MNSTERFAAKLTNIVYCICTFITILVMIYADQLAMVWQFIFGIYMIASILLSQYITRKKSISNLIQGRVEIVLFLFLSCFFGYNLGWGRMLIGMTFFLICLFSTYQLPQLNGELLGMTIVIYGLFFCVYEKTIMVRFYDSRFEIIVEFVILLFAQLIMYFLQKQNAFERRKVYENEQSLDDLLKVVELKCDEAQEAVRVKSSFLANMSHEIRTPINAILGMNEMILRETNQDDVAEYAENVQNAGKSLTAIINDILDFSKMESGKMQLTLSEYSFSSMLNDVTNLIQQKAAEKGLALTLEVDEKIPDKLYGDEVRVKQILLNLLNNAVKYTRNGSVRFIAALEEQNGKDALLTIKVIDTGIGIREEDREKLFHSFMRLDLNRNRNIEGTGLGLIITKQLVTMCKGQIEVESTYGRGSCFTVHLPQQVMDETPIGNYQKRYEARKVNRNAFKERFTAEDAHVLIVDDNIINLKVAAALLKETKIQIELAASGMECLEKCDQMAFDVILMDHMMPQMDGIETLQRLKEHEYMSRKEQAVVVIALTANAVSGAREMYLKAGFDDYLSKPIDSEKLEEMLKHYLPEQLIHVVSEDEAEQEETQEHPCLQQETEPKMTKANANQDIRQLTEYLKRSTDGWEKQLTDCRQQKDWRGAAVCLHSIYAIARELGFENLMELCRQEEGLLRTRRQTYAFEGLDAVIEAFSQVQ